MIGIHLDTDLGSDTDDLCALAMLLGWPDVELTGVTTSTDPGGVRAGMVAYALGLAGRDDVPVAAGAEGSLGSFYVPPAFPDYWPETIEPQPAPAGTALELIASSIDAGSVVVAVGPYTNLAAFEAWCPGALAKAGTFVMGGHVPAANDGFPPGGMRDDFNVQQDAVAARVVFERCDPVVIPVPVCFRVALRERQLDASRSSGSLGKLLADQGEAHARDNGRRDLPAAYPALASDLLNFQYDPLACAVAAGWDGVTMRELAVELGSEGDLLRMGERAGAPSLRVVTEVEAERFEDGWLDAAVRASAAGVIRP